MDIQELQTKLKKYGQEHLLQFWDQLSRNDKEQLYHDINSVDFAEVLQFFQHCTEDLAHAGEKVDDHLQPLPQELVGSVCRTNEETITKYEHRGLSEIASGHVAVLLLAGGQGTRLGVNYPKGMYNVGLPSGKTLYQLQAERVLKLQQLATKATGKTGVIVWYIMTSEHTKEPTEAFFKKHNYFGLKAENVILFEQHTLPCFTFDGKIILDKKHKLARAPDGNGGLYRALGKSGVLADLEQKGVKYLHVYCVDNILVKMADPIFTGFCIEKGAWCGAKVVEKTVPTEPVGVVCKVDGVYQVVEYSEITLKTAEKRNNDGRLTFNAGNICNHFFTTEFLKDVVRKRESELKHHVAKKKIPYVDDQGNENKPSQPNGIKMEKFVFDVFQFTSDRSFAVWEVLREDEFSPLKNADGAAKDTPTTSRHALFNLHQRFLVKAGGKLVSEDGSVISHIPSNGDSNAKNGCDSHQEDSDEGFVVCEVSPLLSYAGEGLEETVKGKSFKPPVQLSAPGEV